MDGVIKMSEQEMDTLASDFASAQELLKTIETNLSAMKSTLGETYDGSGRSLLNNTIETLEERAKMLSMSFGAMSMFTDQVKTTFKDIDETLKTEAENLVNPATSRTDEVA